MQRRRFRFSQTLTDNTHRDSLASRHVSNSDHRIGLVKTTRCYSEYERAHDDRALAALLHWPAVSFDCDTPAMNGFTDCR